MASLKERQLDTVAAIDTAKAMIDKVIKQLGINVDINADSASFSMQPIRYVLELLSHLGVTEKELRDWLASFLVYVVPLLEISTKAILLTNLKKSVDCSSDPRIPEKFRKKHKAQIDSNTSQEYGIDIDIESIDFKGKLNINPLSEEGKKYYFGLDGIKSVHSFARASDFDAFLWYVIHKGKFPNPSIIDDELKAFTNGDDDGGFSASSVSPTAAEGGNLLRTLNVTFNPNEEKTSSIIVGNTFKYNAGNIISICIDARYDESGNTVENTIVPVSDDWSSVNWYARRKEQFVGNIGLDGVFGKDLVSRNYDKERAICNLQYIDQAASSPLTGLVNNKLRFTILPKPYVHIPDIGAGEPPWRFKKMIFNENGEFTQNGKYTLSDVDSEKLTSDDAKIENKKIFDEKSGTFIKKEILKEYYGKSWPTKVFACYPGLTVYEFNYEYIMSLRLFDAKVIATEVIESVLDLRIGVSANLVHKHTESVEMTKKIVKEIIDSVDSSVSDCYFTFDNKKYDALLRQGEERRGKRKTFSKVNDTLNEYTEDAKLNEQVEILQRAITEAQVELSDGIPSKDQYGVRFNFLFDVIEALVTAIVDSVLSPKVLLLLEVNQQLMGGTWEAFSLKDLLMAMRDFIFDMVKELRDMILMELLKLLLKQLSPIVDLIKDILLREQLEIYASVIKNLLINCPSLFGNRFDDTTLDTVDYADIDKTPSSEDGEQPVNKC